MSSRLPIAWLLAPVLVALVALVACDGGSVQTAPSGRAAEPADWNVVVVMVDTLRAENLGLYGHQRDTSPHLDAFARANIWFDNARSQAPCTFPSANTVLTGRFTTEFLGRPASFMGIGPETPSLAQILSDEGYATVAISASPIVRKTPSNFNPSGGFDPGFALFDERCLWNHASCINDRAFETLSILREPFFLYLHYMDPHGPFQPPETWPRRFAGPDDAFPEHIRRGNPNPIANAIYKGAGGADEAWTMAQVDHLLDLYDEEIAYFDTQFQELLDRLEETGLAERTILFLVADHGEEFLEHDGIKHCHTLYDTEIKTPMVLALPPGAPGGGAARAVSAPVANQSVVPTVLDLLGIDPTDHGVGGGEGVPATGWAPSLVPLLAGETDDNGLVYSAWGTRRGVFDGRHKLVYHLEGGRFEMFDLESDPDELDDLLEGVAEGSEPEPFRTLKRALFQFLIDTESGAAAGAAAGKKTEDALRALGYLQ
jgi:arylsulfatase A-like enzyme